MKKVACSDKDCSMVETWQTGKPRGIQYVEVPDDFDETTQKAFCSMTCACYSGYMTMNKEQFERLGGIVVDGHWWLKDPSGGKDKRFEKLNR